MLILTFHEHHVNASIFSLLYVWFLLFKTMFLRFIHTILCNHGLLYLSVSVDILHVFGILHLLGRKKTPREK